MYIYICGIWVRLSLDALFLVACDAFFLVACDAPSFANWRRAIFLSRSTNPIPTLRVWRCSRCGAVRCFVELGEPFVNAWKGGATSIIKALPTFPCVFPFGMQVNHFVERISTFLSVLFSVFRGRTRPQQQAQAARA